MKAGLHADLYPHQNMSLDASFDSGSKPLSRWEAKQAAMTEYQEGKPTTKEMMMAITTILRYGEYVKLPSTTQSYFSSLKHTIYKEDEKNKKKFYKKS
jgi:hypothetical protein